MLEVEDGIACIRSEVPVSCVVEESPLDESSLQSPCAFTLRSHLEIAGRAFGRVANRFDAVRVAGQDLIVDRSGHAGLIHHQHAQRIRHPAMNPAVVRPAEDIDTFTLGFGRTVLDAGDSPCT